MATQEDQLRHILFQSLSPDKSTRQAAEGALLSSRSNPGHALAVLRVVAASNAGGSSSGDLPVRQAAAVHFKNMVKGGSLMCTVPPALQSQCSESIALIAAVDFPERWDNLLPDLISKFTDHNWDIVNGVLLTANSILKRFRFVQRSDALYADILYVLQRIQEPLTLIWPEHLHHANRHLYSVAIQCQNSSEHRGHVGDRDLTSVLEVSRGCVKVPYLARACQ